MKISRELIEKYHRGQCTPDEQQAVEAWLFDDDTTPDPVLLLPVGESKFTVQQEMWQDIEKVLPSRQKKSFSVTYWRQAAAVLLFFLAGATFFFLHNQTESRGIIVVTNTSETANKDLHESAYSISVGPKSNVEIDTQTGRIDFCGAMMINPKHDIELTIQGVCTQPDEKSEKVVLKKGQNYIALNYGTTATNEVIVLPQGSLTGLPPLMQRQLMMQFDI
ncbi:hypothetical protein GCM10027347_09140 [Larkinella harenae]